MGAFEHGPEPVNVSSCLKFFSSIHRDVFYILELAEMRLNSNVKIETILSQISVLHFDPQLVHNLKTAYELDADLLYLKAFVPN